MEHNRSTKIIAIVALVVAVLGISVGFSAYTKALNINNVQATVTGDSANFDVVFSTASDSASDGSVTGSKASESTGVTGGSATLNGTTISDLTASFPSEGGSVEYNFYVYNKGSIPAYLTAVTMGAKTCKGSAGTSDDLVQAACSSITVNVEVGGKSYTSTTDNITDSVAVAAKTGTAVKVTLTKAASASVDGDFTATVPTITLNYSSQKAAAAAA